MSAHFSWQSAVVHSELQSATKLTLLVIGTYMNQHGSGAFPSYATIARRASLSRRTVIHHVDLAIDKGWLVKQARTKKATSEDSTPEQDSNAYAISFPACGGETDAPPSAGDAPPLVQELHPNTPVLTPHIPEAGFDAFWNAYPRMERKVAKAECLKRWKKNGLASIADQIVSHVAAMSQTKTWQDGYAPAPLTYINQRRWEDAEESQCEDFMEGAL